MTDADLIYNALLRAERRIEIAHTDADKRSVPSVTHLRAALIAVQTIREEVGSGLAREGR